MKNINIHSMIRERFAKLPPKLQEAITSTEVAEKLREISKKHRLHIDQGQILENETYMVLLGVEKAEKYESNLKKELGISPEVAKNISNDVAKEIFLSIRNILKESTTPSVQKPKQEPRIPTQPSSEVKDLTQNINKIPTSDQNKLESVVKNQNKEIKINPTKGYEVDPYREPIS